MTSPQPQTAQNATDEQIRQVLQAARRVVVVSHIRPDGDAVGSVVGLSLALKNAGKEVRPVLADAVPASLRFLQGSELISRSVPLEALAAYDTVIVVDASDLLRVGGVLGNFDAGTGRQPTLNIDHHITNLNFAETNLVIGAQVATCAILADRLPAWGLAFDPAIATALLTGIVTDTIGFRTSNMTSEALRLAARLMDEGAELPDLYERALTTKSYESALYWGQGLTRLKQETVRGTDKTLVWTTLTLADRKVANYPGNDDADLVNTLSSIDCDVAVIFVEQKNGHVKVSWRARPGFDVSKIALQFGGGGHAAAAGADIPGTLEAVQEQVLATTRQEIAHYKNVKKD